jgi:hypothetical protein
VPIQSGRNTEGVALGNRFAQQVDERRMDARVLDAGGGKKVFQAVLLSSRVGALFSVRRR